RRRGHSHPRQTPILFSGSPSWSSLAMCFPCQNWPGAGRAALGAAALSLAIGIGASLLESAWGQPARQPGRPAPVVRFPWEKLELERVANAECPYLGQNFQVLAPATPVYNCVAHSLGIHSMWITPLTGPPANPFVYMDQLYAAEGYTRQPGLNYA